MPKIRRATKSGQPGFTTRSVEGFTGDEVSSERETKDRVTIRLARNPAKHQDDPLGFTNHARVPNPNAAPNPKIVNATGLKRRSFVPFGGGVKGVINRAANRNIKKL